MSNNKFRTKFFGGSQATYIMRRTMNRRELLKTLGVGAAMELLPSLATAQPKVMPKALIFDTFGTVVDWRGSIIEEGKAWGKPSAWTSTGRVSRTDGVQVTSLPWRRCERVNFHGPNWTSCIG